MNTTPLVTVSIVLFNEEGNLPKLFESISQVFKKEILQSFHFLFIDNNSSDRSVALIREWQKTNPDFSSHLVQRQENHLAKARTQALELARTQWVAFIDGDSEFENRWPENVLITLGDLEENTVALGGASTYVKGQQTWHEYAKALAHYFPIGKTQSQRVEVDHVPTNNYLVRREAALAIGGFDPFFQFVGEDLDFNVRLREQGRIFYEPLFAVKHALPASVEQWYRKMALYGRAQAYVLLRRRGGIPAEKFLPLLLCTLFNILLFWQPLWSFLGSSVLLMIPRTRFFILTFLFYGLGEGVGFVRYTYLRMSPGNSVHQTHKA